MSATLIASNCSTGSPSASPDWTSIRSELLIACRSSPALAKKLGYLHRDATWKTAVFGLTFRGHLEMLRGWDQFLEVAEDYRVTLREVEDLGGDRVLAAIGLPGRNTGIEMNQPLHIVIALRNGLIVEMDEYGERTEALEAAVLSE